MVSKSIKISKLKVADLRRILDERDLETSGTQVVLKEGLTETLAKEGKDISTYLLNMPHDVSSILNQVLENSTSWNY